MIYQQSIRHLRYRGYPLSSHIDSFDPQNEKQTARISLFEGIPSYRICSLHNHLAVELILVLEGDIRAHTAVGNFEAHQGDILIVNPFEVHQFFSKDTTRAVRYQVINFDCSLLKNRGSAVLDDLADGLEESRYRFDYLIPADASCTEAIRRHMLRLYEIYCAEENDTVASTFAIHAELFSVLSLLCEGGFFGEAKKQKMTRDAVFSQRVVQYVSEHYAEPLSTSTVADFLHFNKSYFCRVFKQVFGESFCDYLNGFRISVAKTLLLSEYHSLSAIAEAVGYVNYTVFAKNFKELTGVSPKDFYR